MDAVGNIRDRIESGCDHEQPSQSGGALNSVSEGQNHNERERRAGEVSVDEPRQGCIGDWKSGARRGVGLQRDVAKDMRPHQGRQRRSSFLPSEPGRDVPGCDAANTSMLVNCVSPNAVFSPMFSSSRATARQLFFGRDLPRPNRRKEVNEITVRIAEQHRSIAPRLIGGLKHEFPDQLSQATALEIDVGDLKIENY